jgi:hypothetical protein
METRALLSTSTRLYWRGQLVGPDSRHPQAQSVTWSAGSMIMRRSFVSRKSWREASPFVVRFILGFDVDGWSFIVYWSDARGPLIKNRPDFGKWAPSQSTCFLQMGPFSIQSTCFLQMGPFSIQSTSFLHMVFSRKLIKVPESIFTMVQSASTKAPRATKNCQISLNF